MKLGVKMIVSIGKLLIYRLSSVYWQLDKLNANREVVNDNDSLKFLNLPSDFIDKYYKKFEFQNKIQ